MSSKSIATIFVALAIPVSLVGCATAGAVASKERLAVAVNADGLAHAGDLAAAAPVAPAKLYSLYAGHSWLWQTGAGYFAPDHRFIAWSNTDGFGSYAEGRWHVNRKGQMCMNATWHGNTGSAADTTCFDHVKVGNAIYQRKAPIGEWYLFKGPDLKKPGEYAKFRKGDHVSKLYRKTRAQEN